MRAYPTSAIGTVATFLAGFVAHDVLGPALRAWPRAGGQLDEQHLHEHQHRAGLLVPGAAGAERPQAGAASIPVTMADDNICPGLRVLVTYSDDPGWTHERVLVWPRNEARTSWQIYTPGNDLYAEDFGDYASLIPMTGRRRHPPGVRNVVAFNWELQAAEWVSLIKRGRGEAVLEHGLPANGWWAGAGQDWRGGRLDIPAPTAVEVPRARRRLRKKGAEDEMGEWRLIEYVQDDQADSWRDDKLVAADRQRPPRGALGDRLFGGGGGGTATPPGGPAVAAVASGTGEEQAEDLRACWIDVDETGSRFKEWRKVVQESTQEVLSDSSLRGPPACLEAYAHGADHANWAAAKHPAGTTNPLDLVPEALRSYASRLSKEEHELEALRARAKTPIEGHQWATRRFLFAAGPPERAASRMKMYAISADVQQRVFSAARRWIDVDSAVSEEEALARLLKGKAGYAPLGSTSTGSYEYSRVSLPDSVVDAPFLTTMLPAQAKQYLEEFASRMLLPPREAALIRELDGLPGCHADPLLLQRQRSYGKFARRALSIGLGLGRIEMPIMEVSDFTGLCAVLGVGDVADCFHRMKLQGDIRHYLCWPPLDAALTGEALVEGRPVHAGEQVWPMSQSLPMGFSWSLYFARAANQCRLDRQPSLAGSLRLSDRGPPLVLGQGAAGSELGHYMCVDSAGVIGFDAARVTCALQEAQRDFDGDHLKFHEVAGWQLEMVLGHMTFMALVRREVLSIFHPVYAFVAQSYHTFSVLWPTVRDELNCYLGIVVMLESSWTRPWTPVVYSSDASLHGYGVAEACFGTETVAEIGRVSELARWRLGAGLARQHAFECAGFLLDRETGEVVRDEAGAPKRLDAELQRVLASERWELDPSFHEVASWLLHDSHWATVMADRWAFADDIFRLETRALVKAAAREGSRRRTLSRTAVPTPAAPLETGRRRARALSSTGRRLESGGPPPAQRSRTLDQSRGLAARLVLEGAARPPQQSSVEACLRLSPDEPRQAGKAIAGHGVAEVEAESESVESSDAEEPPAAARPRRRLETRGKARIRKAIEVFETAESGRDDVKLGISYLEKRSVGAGTLETYRQCVLAFCVWARCCLTALPELKELGGQLVEYMNEEFLKGVKAWRGEKLLAGLMFFYPDFGRLGGLRLPRSWRCLKGWKKLSPSRSRKPLVFAIWAALAVELCRLGAPLVGAMVLIMVECYLRPGEMLSLTSDSFLAPTEHAVQNWVVWLFPEAGVARSKVGSADDTIPCDSGRCPWMCHIFKALKGRQSSRPLLDLSYPQFLRFFRRAATNIGADVVPHQGRHSGASLDRATGRRSLEEVQKRGRWAAMSSVKRYEKSGRPNESWEKLGDASKAHCAAAAKLLQEVLMLGRPAPAPPYGGREGSRGLR
ncbi:unnamed protein product [Prorocentrum cordatum]|uniref:Tyr recombinase domain-containing protein n=1 Tax=Prorocentrum cordatum TaxID=2364126 RepID=A0ABN9PFU9_9DINO|nr:unnamed protein product [Polarella glacialis]